MYKDLFTKAKCNKRHIPSGVFRQASTTQINSWSVKNAPYAHTGLCTTISYLYKNCVFVQKPTFPRNGSECCRSPQAALQLSPTLRYAAKRARAGSCNLTRSTGAPVAIKFSPHTHFIIISTVNLF